METKMTESARSFAGRLWRQAHPYTRNMITAFLVLAALVTVARQLDGSANRQHHAAKKRARAVPNPKESPKAVVLEQEAKQ